MEDAGGALSMRYHIHLIVNTPEHEYEYTIADETSLDAAVERILETHPNCTSMVMTIVLGVTTLGQSEAI